MGVIESDASETSDSSASRLADTDSESESDYVAKHCRITYLAMLLPMISIITHIADVALDANLAYSYYVSAEYLHFRLTLLFILFPAFVNTVISARMFPKDENRRQLWIQALKWKNFKPSAHTRLFVYTSEIIIRCLFNDLGIQTRRRINLLQQDGVINCVKCLSKTKKNTYDGVNKSWSKIYEFIHCIRYVADEYNMTLSKIATKKWLLRIFMLFFQMAPILRHCEVLVYAWKSWKAAKEKHFANQRQCYELMVKEDADAALLRLFECFLEAAPQQVLQGTIILTRTKEVSTFTYDSQMASFGSSMLNIGWSVASYQRVIRLARQDKENITWKGTIIQFLWHFMVTVSRILSISVASVMFPTETAVLCGVHWLIVTVWLSLWERTNFCFSQKVSATKQQAAEILFCSVLGLVYIFTYITPKDGQNRIRYSIYYTICFAENVMAAVTVWATADMAMQNEWYFYPLLLGCIVPFVIGIGFMILYYSCFHPVLQRVKCCGKSNDRDQTGNRGLRSTRTGSLGRNLLTLAMSLSMKLVTLSELAASGCAEVLRIETKFHEESQQDNGEENVQNSRHDVPPLPDTEVHQCNNGTQSTVVT